jgi:hypothetical protein
MTTTGSDLSLLPVIVGGLLTLGGVAIATASSVILDVLRARRDRRTRRGEKFEELVAAIYEYDHWLESLRNAQIFEQDISPRKPSPFAKIEAISAVYFPQFLGRISQLGDTVISYRVWITEAAQRRHSGEDNFTRGFEEVFNPYREQRDELLRELRNAATHEFG